MTTTTPPTPADGAGLVLTGGQVLTLDAAGTTATALAAQDGRILYVGDDAGAQAFVGAGTRVIDLEGRTLLPGINESHLHASWLGVMWPATIMGAMAAGTVPDADAGPSPLTDSEQRRAAIVRAGDIAASYGITSYTEPGLGPGEDRGETGACGSDTLEQYRLLADEGRLRARVNVLALFGIIDGPSEIGFYETGIDTVTQGSTDPSWLRIAGVKIFADGIPPMHSAWINGQYSDGTSGDLLVRGSDLAEREANMRRMIRLAHERGLQVGMHATGDRSIATFLDEVERLGGATGDLRHYVIHGDLVTDDQLPRLAAAGMGLNMQAGLTAATAGMMGAALGDDAVASSWPITGALRAGIPLCLSSDGPVLSPDWRLGYAAAAAWVGDSLGDVRETALALLRCYTVNGARQDHAETWKGTLEVGKVADLCVLAGDPLTTEPSRMPELAIDYTIVDGRIVFDRAVDAAPIAS